MSGSDRDPDLFGGDRASQRAWRNLLKRHGIRPDKSLGQNFLFSYPALNKVVRAADLDENDTVLEIGAGVGSLTRLLAERAGRVVAVEFDERLLPALREAVSHLLNVRVVAGDIMDLPLGDLVGDQPYRVVANIPYNLTSALIRKLMESPHPPQNVVLTVQREVAERVCAQPGDMNLLALGVQVYGVPTVKGIIKAGAFYPSPSVDSAILRIDRYAEFDIQEDEIDRVFELAHAAFEQKRKQLHNSLEHGLPMGKNQAGELLENAGIDPTRRPQTLAMAEWIALARAYEGWRTDQEKATG